MCLYIRNKQTYIAKKDMICYKICIEIDDTYYSFFRHYKYTLNKVANSEISIIESSCSPSGYYAEEGLHTFKYLKDTRDFIGEIKRENNNITNVEFIILKCIIPKDSTFIDGIFTGASDKTYTSYVSNRLKPILCV